MQALGEYQRALKLSPEMLSVYPVVADMHLEVGELAEGLNVIKECLRRDPEMSKCMKAFRKYKNLEKGFAKIEESSSKNRWNDVVSFLVGDDFVSQAEQFGKLFSLKAYSTACLAYKNLKQSADTIKWCTKTLDAKNDDFEALLARADAYMETEEYQKGMYNSD
jgi:tetratricopeptide (TPR) repeat protein